MKSNPTHRKLLLGLLLPMLMWWGMGNVYGQADRPLTEVQKIQMDEQNRMGEAAIVPLSELTESTRETNALSFIEIGDGSTYGTSPAQYADWANFWENGRTQTLYLASELGGPKTIKGLQYAFERVPSAPNNYHVNVQIRIFETNDNALTTGNFYDASSAALVYSSPLNNYIPATATGWGNMIEIDDYVYNGTSNLIVEVLFGDNNYYSTSYYRTYKTNGSANRLLIGYADSETPPNYDGASTYFSNIRFYYEDSAHPVSDVVAFELDADKVQVSWGDLVPPPPPLVQQWLGYDNNGVPTEYWWAGPGTPFSWAINFEPTDLAGLAGTSLTKISIFGTEVSDVNTLNIYEGNLEAGTATLIHTQAITGLNLEAWNEVNLTVPVPIDITKQLWVSMHSPNPTSGIAASTPILNLKGDWVNFTGSWEHMSSGLGFNVTWSLRAFATNAANRSVTQLVNKYAEPRYMDVANTALTSTRIVGAKPFRPVYSDRAIVDYTVWREKVYQPGTLIELGSTSQTDFVDFSWGTMDWGIYRWAVTANHDDGQVSEPSFSNVLEKNMDVVVSVDIALNSNESPGGTSVTFTNTSEPELELDYNVMLDNSGTFTWNAFRRGIYDIQVMHPGYAMVQQTDVEIYDNATFTWLLEEILAPPSDLYVTPTAFATWNLDGSGTGGFEPFLETFDGLANGQLPAGWTKSPETAHWGAFASSAAGGTIPEMRMYYTPTYTGQLSLMSPSMNTSGQTNLSLSFNNYLWHYSNSYSYSVKVIAIADGVEYIIQEWSPVTANIPIGVLSYNLTAAHGVGASDFKIAWVFNGNTFGIYWWTFDNVMVNGSRAKAGRSFETSKVFLDGQLITETTDNQYQYGTNGEVLVPYQTYTAGVAAVYSTGQSPRAEYDFIYVPCGDYATPTAFAAAQVEGTLNILLEWTNVNAAALDTVAALRIFRNGEQYAEIDFSEQSVSSFLDENLEFGQYTYCLTYVYDSGAETCEGVVCSGEIEIDGNATVNGMVTRAAYLGGGPLGGASVLLADVNNPAITFEFFTNSSGMYTGTVIAGTYDYTVSATGYTSVELNNVEIVLNATVTNDFVLVEFPDPPIGVQAVEITDNSVQVTWHSPAFAPFEPIFETFNSGIPSTWTVVDGGSTPDTWYMETPAGNPQTAGASLDGSNFAHVDSDEAGSGASLLEMLYTPVVNASTVENLYLSFDQYYRHLGSSSGKVEVYDGAAWVTVLNQTATAGAWSNPNHQLIDVSTYANEAFQVRFVYTDGTSWSWFWAIDNVAITNEVTRSGAPVLANTPAPERSLYAYQVYRTTCETGDLQFLGLTLDTLFNDNTWGAVETGMYKWGVRAVYDQENYSETIFSNCLDKDMVTAVSVQVGLNSGDSPEGTTVRFTNTSEPELELFYTATLDETGYFAWEEFRKGTYDIHVEKLGFEAIDITDEIIDGPKNYEWLLEELLLPVSDLHVSPTGFASWRDGGIVPFEPFMEDFSGGIDAWTRIPATANWQLSQTNLAGGSAPEVRFYWSPNTTNRFYFISPMMSTLTQTEIEMSFDHFINDFGGGYTIQLVTIADGVEHVAMDFPASSVPATNVVTTLTAAHGVGAEEFQIAFVYEGAAFDINWWNIDNIMLYTPGSRELTNYKIWLDGVWIADPVDNFYQYDAAILTPGQEYFSEVAAMYDNGMSAKMNYTWTYYPCDSFPGPADLAYEVVDINNVVLTWGGTTPPPPPGGGIDEDFEGGSMPDGWTVQQTNTASATGPTPSYWTVNNYISSDFSPFGTYHAGMWWDYSHQDEWLITPEFTCDAGASLNFWATVYEGSVYGDHYQVKASTDGGTTWTSIWDASALSGNAWNYYNSPYNVALTAYAGQNIKLAFNAVDGDGQGLWYIWFVDNITVGSSTRTIAFSPESLIRKSNATGNNDQIARDGNIARITRNSANVNETTETGGRIVKVAGVSQSLSSNRAVLYNSGPLINSPGTGPGGTDESILQSTTLGMNTLGAGCQFLSGNHMADHFVVDADWTIESFTFYTYQTGSTTTSTITGGYLQIYDGKPSAGGTVVWGDMVTNRMSSTAFTNGYRLSEGTPGTTRPIMDVVCSTPGLTLTPGTYWVEFTLDGSLTSGPWAPPITITGQATTGNAIQLVSTGWQEWLDSGTNTPQGVPFLINGTSGGGTGGGSTFDPGEFLGANVYRDGELIAEMIQGETYTDPEVEPGYYDYCVTFVYEGNAMSCMTTCVEDVLVTEDCKVPQNLTAVEGEANEVTLAWNQSITQEFRYDDGVSTGQLGFSGGTINGVLGAKHSASAEITELSWFTTPEGGPHNTVQIYVFGLTSAGMPNGSNVLYTASVTNTDNTWNTHTLSTPVYADGGFYIAIGYNGFAGLGTDDGVGAPYVYQDGTHYYASDYTTNAWTTFESSGFSVNAMIRAIGIVDAKASYTVAAETTPEMAAEFDKTLNPVIYTISNPVETGTPQWSVPVANRYMNRAFLGYNIYRNGSIFEALWPETTYVYQEGNGGESCYTVTAEYEYCGETDPSNEACLELVNVKSNDLSQIKVYPNPSNSTVNIELTNNISQVVIYNYLGQVVLENNITDVTTLQIDVRNYESGAYLVKFITNQGQSLTKKVVVTK